MRLPIREDLSSVPPPFPYGQGCLPGRRSGSASAGGTPGRISLPAPPACLLWFPQFPLPAAQSPGPAGSPPPLRGWSSGLSVCLPCPLCGPAPGPLPPASRRVWSPLPDALPDIPGRAIPPAPSALPLRGLRSGRSALPPSDPRILPQARPGSAPAAAPARPVLPGSRREMLPAGLR